MSRIIFAVLWLMAAPAGMALAQDAPESRGSYGDWRVFTRPTDAGLVCYALSRPQDEAPRALDHGGVYFLVASWQSGVVEEQPNIELALGTGFATVLTRTSEALVTLTAADYGMSHRKWSSWFGKCRITPVGLYLPRGY